MTAEERAREIVAFAGGTKNNEPDFPKFVLRSFRAAENDAIERGQAEIDRLQAIIDSRPAINAGLPETYIRWSRSIYELEAVRAVGAQQ